MGQYNGQETARKSIGCEMNSAVKMRYPIQSLLRMEQPPKWRHRYPARPRPPVKRQPVPPMKPPIPLEPALPPRRQPRRNRAGTYTTAPVAISSYVSGNTGARIVSRGGKTIVRHRELVATIVGQGPAFAINNGTTDVFPINPTDPSTFKWLSTIASNYDTYNLLSCCLEYVPLCSTGFVGRVALFYDRDSQDAGPFDRNELSNYAYLTETAPWAPATLDLPDLRGERFCQDQLTNDARLSDAGRIGWATYNTNVNDVEGDLFICYEVELLNAQPASSATMTVRSTGASFGPRYALSVVFTQAATSTLVVKLNTGAYFLDFIAEATGAGITSTTAVLSGDISLIGNLFNASNANRATDALIVVNRDTKATITFQVAGGTITSWALAISRASANNSIF